MRRKTPAENAPQITPSVAKVSYRKLPYGFSASRKIAYKPTDDRVYSAAFSFAEKPSAGALYSYMRAVLGSGGSFWQLRR